MRPLDPRLVRASPSVRKAIAASVCCTIISTAATITLAIALARVITRVVIHSNPVAGVELGIIAGALLVKIIVTAVHSGIADTAGWVTTHNLRDSAFRALLRSPHNNKAVPSVALTDGLDAAWPYVTRFLPTLLATMVVTPALLIVTWWFDPVSAILELVAIPLIPLFMALVGWSTQSAARRRLATSEKLATQLADLLAGLPTLRFARRATAQRQAVLDTARRYKDATNAVLRQAFLSSLVLEVLTTLAVALVAVVVGTRLISGDLQLEAGLAVLILAPEVFLPLRQVGMHFHASADGVEATSSALEVMERPARPDGDAPLDGTVTAVAWENVSVDHDGRHLTAPAELTARADAGRITALVGPTGCGKSTAISALLGLLTPTHGETALHLQQDGTEARVPTADVARADWHSHVAWVPQRPAVTPGTLRDNLWIPDTAPLSDDDVADVIHHAGLTDVVAALPQGMDTAIGTGGFGLSAGQRHRIGIARALVRTRCGAQVLIVDEPTAHLDPATDEVIVGTLKRCAKEGLVVIAVAHRGSLVDAADHVVAVRSAVSAEAPTHDHAGSEVTA